MRRRGSLRGRPHWSYSAIAQYLRCPLQYYFQRILKLRPPFQPSALVIGSAVHEALALYHESVVAEQPASPAEVVDAVRQTWARMERDTTIAFRTGEKREGAIEQAVALLECYLQEPLTEKIRAVEVEILTPIENSRGEVLEKPLVSVLDLVVDGERGPEVVDFKTSARRYSQEQADTALQATCYVNAIRESWGPIASFRFAVLLKTKTPKVQHVSTDRDDTDLRRLGDLVEAVDRSISSESFYPVESPLNCSTCQFRAPCRQWSGQKSTEEKAVSGLAPEGPAC